ncbi:MAG TPA: LysM peptidoglycan-binding domain-containing M23 family metallopeptidase [Anaerolineales bacterium]|nr:LysM peptidoglycan-binding domain-containing M23 family metallopeptidase [Anaerolineales bacterium]HNB35449.1 LysM peptidoglycan-binding domain-containing M23 family metallopeptidase [Anaerolineales bacterium]HNC07253.1 LysM peptidoglycan-binding domain-containing M23 family metallopeptidase [Anaerolineales bacterium]
MPRTIAILIILSLTISACGSSPSLWGVASTPTVAPSQSTPLTDPFAGQTDPIIFPTSTNPPFIETQAAATPQAVETESTPSVRIEATPSQAPLNDAAPFLYYAQSGDMLSAVAARFGVSENEIISDADLTRTTLIDPGTLLIIPNRINERTTPNIQLLPDAEFVYSATAIGFDTEKFIKEQGGYLSTFRDYLGSSGWLQGYDAIDRLAIENSVNPRLLLALLEFEARWVRGQPIDLLHTEYPMGFNDYRYKGMSVQMTWAINTMSIAYYGWRAGTITHIDFPEGTRIRLDPRLNAGTVAVQYLFSRLHSESQWSQIINPDSGFPALYEELFGDAWARADLIGPIFPPGLNQPPLVLPFEPGVKWSFTGGPHNGWGQISPNIYGQSHSVFSAIDFAPAADKPGCIPTTAWAVASAPGLVVRSENGVVMLDLDGDGYEQTGWDLLYLHMANEGRVELGALLETNDHIGHPSCEGGVATGTHLHFARKFNGEWVTADGPIPFVLSDWRVVAGTEPYKGKLVKGDQVITADLLSQLWSNVIREADE